MPTAKCVGASRLDGVLRPWNPHALIAFGFKPTEYETARFRDEDADLIAALRNAAPRLIAELRKLDTIARVAKEAASYDWGTSVSEAYHYERMAAMDRLRAAMEGAS